MIETLEPLSVFAMAHSKQWRAVRFELDIWDGVEKPEELWMMNPSGPWRRHPYFILLMVICNEPVLLGEFFHAMEESGEMFGEGLKTMT